ncbi:Uncaracterized surface protein containing fasciclin (FAS1) repeats [Nocardioides scoriae]|uniref:Uncaracterized surface protein containing fasciclin (FAS1) repeats n=1 Tax=Nocardioides scoriae TaxID=642780 RepID=A0A1H1SZD2_9ACTN|nr:fasciclin domain-containing protein [Nocardioides scoriae]SDS53330.1 Uncaracterized surface protein containing fasciclin (FAS1) repeats [Nocardioides scoriae]
MNTKLRRTGLAAMALTVSFGMAACGSSDDSGSASSDSSSSASSSPSESPSASESAAAASGEFGSACSAVPASGPGSFQGMSTAPVATAASNNPVLKTLVAAVTAADLGDTLNSAQDITVFAPANDAFAAIPKKDLNALLKDKAALTKVLQYHVVAGKLSPEDLAGTHKTLEGQDVTVKGSGEEFTVGSADANVICGNVQTANATVYIIDGVLSPPAN